MPSPSSFTLTTPFKEHRRRNQLHLFCIARKPPFPAPSFQMAPTSRNSQIIWFLSVICQYSPALTLSMCTSSLFIFKQWMVHDSLVTILLPLQIRNIYIMRLTWNKKHRKPSVASSGLKCATKPFMTSDRRDIEYKPPRNESSEI